MQHNTVTGLIVKTTAANLTDKENHLVELNSSGLVGLTNAATDHVFGVVVSGAASGALADILPVNPGQQINVKVSASVSAGALLQLDASNPGQLVTRTTGKAVAMAESASSSGVCKCRFFCGTVLPVTVVANTGAAAADLAALKVIVAEIHAAGVAAGFIATS